ncbi:MAG: recombinase family protein [Thermodesulfobacteriota bacterium]|nr:recombinase family protein [Thermodesulfobacteriota bacterium]
MTTVAYLRVSTDDQDVEKFRADILKFAHAQHFGHVDFVEEKVSGRKSWKERKLKTIIDDLGKGDRLVFPELTRSGRSTLEVLEIIKTAKEKGIDIFSVKENLSLNGNDLQTKIMTTLLALFSEVERDFISLRTREALAAKKAAGIKLGRPKGPGKSKLDKFRPEIEALLKDGSTKAFIAKRYKTTPANLHHWLKKRGIDIKAKA